MRQLHATYAIAALSAVLAAFLAFWPIKNQAVTDPTKNVIPDLADAATEFHALATLFDRSQLPEPAQPQTSAANDAPAAPPPDPAASLRKYRYLGMAKSDGRQAAVFGGDNNQNFILKPDESIDGFKLLSLDGISARFEKEGQDFELPLSSEQQ
ncbi:MAG: hypothetical protein GXP04_10075 [Alphaproteobacteria bacterium]|nr:hypothetical protein [Alphaproteobacteria bacterium]